MAAEENALRVLVDSILSAHAGKCLDRSDERDTVAADLVDVLAEYMRPMRQEDSQT